VNNLPKVVTQRCSDRQTDRQIDMLTTPGIVLPHRRVILIAYRELTITVSPDVIV